jgi:3-hydroxyacyl-CoA dehydrogenase/enoyl-CoA hydratase/3-hydroxybutyryl-CoA epimerase
METSMGPGNERQFTPFGPAITPPLQNDRLKEGVSTKSEKVLLEYTPNGQAILRLGALTEKGMVTFSRERLASLEEIIKELEKNPPLNGLVITGSKPGSFCAGADINEFKNANTVEDGMEAARYGQSLFNRIEALNCHKVAAINGMCLGGGYEITLTCDYRIAADSGSVKLGLPETNLGIIPAWGGTQRLARLVGAAQAITIMNEAKILDVKTALKLGMIDEVVSAENLEKAALQAARTKKISSPKINSQMDLSFMEKIAEDAMLNRGVLGKIWRRFIKDEPFEIATDKAGAWRNALGRLPTLYRMLCLEKINKAGGEHYPAKHAVVYSVVLGLIHGTKAGLEHDARALGELLLTDVSRGMSHFYHTKMAAKALGNAAKKQMNDVTIFGLGGGGLMGADIMGVGAKSDAKIYIRDTSEDAVKRGKITVAEIVNYSSSLSDVQKKERIGNVDAAQIDINNLTAKDIEALKRSDIVIEAIKEDLGVKQNAGQKLSPHLRPGAIWAWNTSTLPIGLLSQSLVDPTSGVGLHFFNPARKMVLAEAIPWGIQGKGGTRPEVLQYVCALAVKMGKDPIVVADVPGFLVNRILFPYMNECSYLFRDGYSIQQIDNAAKRFGMHEAPMHLFDKIGFGVCKSAADTLCDAYSDRMIMPPGDNIGKLMEAGRHGARDSGFYTYKTYPPRKKGGDPFIKETPDDDAIRAILNVPLPATPPSEVKIMRLAGQVIPFFFAERRMILAMLNEAVRSFDEGVAGTPGPAAADVINHAMTFGAGFAPYLGGILRYGNLLGAQRIVEEMAVLEKICGPRFKPWEKLIERARNGEPIYTPE